MKTLGTSSGRVSFRLNGGRRPNKNLPASATLWASTWSTGMSQWIRVPGSSSGRTFASWKKKTSTSRARITSAAIWPFPRMNVVTALCSWSARSTQKGFYILSTSALGGGTRSKFRMKSLVSKRPTVRKNGTSSRRRSRSRCPVRRRRSASARRTGRRRPR